MQRKFRGGVGTAGFLPEKLSSIFKIPTALLIACGFLFSAPAFAQDTASLTIKIERVSKNRGDIRIAMYDGSNWGGTEGKPAAGAVVSAIPGQTVVTLTGLKPGTYAIKTFQDENRNEKMDFDWFGIPTERFGFSNDAKPRFEQPSFDQAKFEVKPGANATTITLRWLF
ncbi:MAG TPA: DUF2141 domain-containing protein [Rhizomicrobium sp.]|nr:DUF2141 domain-containing protein [Rhizomicrobium sp.]